MTEVRAIIEVRQSRARSTALAIGGSLLGLLLVAACAPAAPSAAPSSAAVANSPAATPATSALARPSAAAAPSPAASPSASIQPAVAPAASAAVPVTIASPSAAARQASGGPIGGWQWQSTQRSSGASVVAADPSRYTITFQPDGSVKVRADCNQVGGTYAVSGSSLTISLGPSTLVACPPDSQADQFLAGLNAVTSYTMTSGNLELGLASAGRMLLMPSPPLELVGPVWQLSAYNNGRGGLQSVLGGTQATATFDASGLVSGSGGCNTFSASFQSSTTSLSIGPVAATRKACEQSIMDQESAYFAALERTSRYQFENGRLVLVDSGGARQAEFNP